ECCKEPFGNRQRVACPYCNRKFDAHRVEKHENVCVKLFNTKRKLFDSFKYRIQGTDIEKFNKQQKTFPTPEKHWRQKHENLVNTLRESRKTQKLLLKDGKSSKAPQVPSKDNPESSRKYSSFAAERYGTTAMWCDSLRVIQLAVLSNFFILEMTGYVCLYSGTLVHERLGTHTNRFTTKKFAKLLHLFTTIHSVYKQASFPFGLYVFSLSLCISCAASEQERESERETHTGARERHTHTRERELDA
uniref:Zinc finger C2HC domain-containing protein 1C-like n=1 Tax=Erpetoichthys calabaricus TaxID=27687 RepID=A0A8C4SS99_ERPCA